MRIETERLIIRDVEDGDVEALVPIFLTNPVYLELTEGNGTAYDAEKLRRELAIARATPGRRFAGVYLVEAEEPVAVVDWLLENESDGKPWIGLLLVRADRQHDGIASEAFAAVARELRRAGGHVVRAGVIDGNRAGTRLTARLGFRRVGSKTMQLGSGRRKVWILERPLEEG